MAKEGKYNLFYKDFDSVREIVRSAFLYGGYSKADYCALTGISPRKYEDCTRFMREVFGDSYAYVNEGKEKYARLNYKAFETATNPLAHAAAFRGFTCNDLNCYFHALDLLTDKPDGMTVEQLLDAFCDRGMVCDRGTVRNGLEAMVGEGYLTKEQSGRQAFYKTTNDLSKQLSVAELEELADYLSLAKDIGRYRLPLYSLARKLPDSDFGEHIKIGGYYPAQVLDEEVRFTFETAVVEKRAVNFNYLNAKKETIQIESAVPVKLLDGDYGRQYAFCFLDFGRPCVVFRLDRISNLRLTDASLEATFDESFLDSVWCVAIPQHQEVHCITIDFDFDGDTSLARRLERNKKFGTVAKLESGQHRYTINIKEYTEMIPFLRTFYSYIVSMNNEDLKRKIADDLMRLGGAYGLD